MGRNERIDEETYAVVSSNLKDINFDEMDPNNLKEMIIATQSTIRKEITKPSMDVINQTELKKRLVKMATYYFFEILIRHRDIHKINAFAILLCDLFEINTEQGLWLLKKLYANQQLFLNVSVVDTSSEVRDSISKLTGFLINNLYLHESKYIKDTYKYFTIDEVTHIDDQKSLKISVREGISKFNKGYRACVSRFFERNLVRNFDFLRTHWQKFHQFIHVSQFLNRLSTTQLTSLNLLILLSKII